MTPILQLIRNDPSPRRMLLSAAILCALLVSAGAPAQDPTTTPAVKPGASGQPEIPEANPGRPTVSTPATLTPVGYLQFETGALAAWHSSEFSRQTSFTEVIKFSVLPRVQFLAAANPFAHSDTQPNNGTGDTLLGIQGVVHNGEGLVPTFALSYFGLVRSGNAPNLDIGSTNNSATVLISADVKKFHYDTNYLFNEAVGDQGIRRIQFGQTLSVSHPLGGKFGACGEIWHFTQPFVRGEAVGNLWAVNYNAKRNLVLDAALDRGLTSTSTRWEFLAGFTYLLPRRIDLRRAKVAR
jgi:hypothetical protein